MKSPTIIILAFMTFSSVSSYYVRLLAPASDVELEDWRATTTQRQHTNWEKLNLINMITSAMAKQYAAAVSIQYTYLCLDTYCYVELIETKRTHCGHSSKLPHQRQFRAQEQLIHPYKNDEEITIVQMQSFGHHRKQIK